MLQDQLTMKGALTISKNGTVVREIDNLVVTSGKNLVAANLAGGSTTVTHMGIGTGSTAAAAGDTTLGSESARAALGTSGGTVSGAVVTFEATFAAGTATGALTEAGLFTASSAGTMLARTVFATINKGANDSVTVSWSVTVS
jgi:hypothetical protein